MKKVLAIMLVCFMLVSLLPMGALAAENEAKCPGEGEHHYKTNCEYTFVKDFEGVCGGYDYTVYQCNECGDKFAADFVKIDGTHNYEVTKTPTHSKPGEQVCTICGHKETVECDGKPGALEGNCLEGWIAKCDKCGETLESKPGEHAWGKLPSAIVKEPTLTEDGLAEYTCGVCGVKKEVVILSHVCEEYMVDVEEKPASCTEDGYTAHQKCTFCNETFGKEVLPAHGHGEPEAMVIEGTQNVSSYGQYYLPAELTGLVTFSLTNATTGSWYYVNVQTTYDDGWTWETLAKLYNGDTAEVELVAGQQYRMYSFTSGKITYSSSTMEQVTIGDCETDGTRVWQCSLCHEKVTENLGRNHNFAVEYHTEPTCTTYGYTIESCVDCGEHSITRHEPLGHTERPEDAYSVNPGCAEDGYYYWWCERCDEEIHETIPATGCPTETIVYEATCGQYGYSITYCTRGSWCDLYNWSTNPMVSEITGKLPNGEEVTIELDGRYMLVSFEILSDKNPDKHNPGTEHEPQAIDPTCTEDGLIIYWCVDCQKDVVEILPALGHEWAEELLVVAPSCDMPGYIAQVCTVCGELNWETIEFVELDEQYVYSKEDAEIAHDIEGVTPEQYRPGNCEVVGLDRYQCATCGQYILVKDETTGFHVMPEGLLEKDDPNNQVVIPVFEGTVYSGSVDAENAYDGHYYSFEMPCDGKVTIEKDGNYYVSGIGDYYTYTQGQIINVNIWAYDAFEYTVTITPYVEGARNQEFCGKDATCTEAGYTAQWYCTVCDEFFASEEIKATGHKEVIDVEASKPTCTEAGATKGSHCEICGEILNVSEEIPALGHTYELVDFRYLPEDGSYVEYTYEHWQCTVCGDEYIKDYVSYCKHELSARPVDHEDPTCEQEGFNVFKCKYCDYTEKVVLEKLPHVNAAGQDLTKCHPSITDFKCVNGCKNEFAKVEHSLDGGLYYEANCLTNAYIMYNCTECAHYEVVDIDDKKGDHSWSDWAPVVDDNGVIVAETCACRVCGEVDIRDVETIAYSAEIEGAITDGSLVKVVIAISGDEDFAWGFKLNVAYSENLKFVEAKFVTTSFTYANVATNHEGYVTILANADGEVELNGKENLVELYFTVNAPEVSEIAVGFVTVETLDAEGKPVEFVAYGDTAKTVKLMDLDLDGEVTLADALAAYNVITAAGYNVAADLDGDGAVTLVDYLNLFNYLSGALTYEEVVALR